MYESSTCLSAVPKLVYIVRRRLHIHLMQVMDMWNGKKECELFKMNHLGLTALFEVENPINQSRQFIICQ